MSVSNNDSAIENVYIHKMLNWTLSLYSQIIRASTDGQ